MARRKKNDLPPNVRVRGKGYSYRYEVPYVDENGKKHRGQTETQIYTTPDEAYRAGILIEAKLIDGTYVIEDKTAFYLWAPNMLDYHIKVKRLRKSSRKTYMSLLKHAITYFNVKPINNIVHDDYQNFLYWLQLEKGLSISTIEMIHAIISSLFKYAKRKKQVTESPCFGAIMPTPPDEVVDFNNEIFLSEEVPNYLEKNQLAAILNAAKALAKTNDPRKAFIWRQMVRIMFVLANTGMRIGELGALELTKINKDQLTIKVIATMYDDDGLRNYEIGPPKTPESRRIIDIALKVMNVIEDQIKDLKAFKLLNGENYHKDRDFIFIMPSKRMAGYPLPNYEVNKRLETLLPLIGLDKKYITVHGFRHTFTSLSAEAGVSLDDIRRQLGHKKDDTTRLVYMHTTQTRRKANVDKLDALIGDLFL